MGNDRFKFRVAIRQEDGTYKRFEVGTIAFRADKIIVEYSYIADANHGKIGRIVIDGETAILEQCTGLRDKNNNLIYEGDVVDFNGEYSGKVLFKNGCFVWDWGCNDPPIYDLDKEYIEIIGNIHERKENT